MIEIKITDPHLMDKVALRKTVSYLLGLIGDEIQVAPTLSQIHKASHLLDVSETQPIAPPHNPFGGNAVPRVPTPPPLPISAPVPVPPALAFNPPVAPQVAPIAPPAGIDVDANGLPWDARIHSRGKSKLTNGTWKLKREIDAKVVEKVEAELRQALTARVPVASVLTAPNAPVSPHIAAPVNIHPVIEDPINPSPNDFPKLMALVTEYTASGKITQVILAEIVKDFGLPSFPLAATRPDIIPALIAAIQARAAV